MRSDLHRSRQQSPAADPSALLEVAIQVGVAMAGPWAQRNLG